MRRFLTVRHSGMAAATALALVLSSVSAPVAHAGIGDAFSSFSSDDPGPDVTAVIPTGGSRSARPYLVGAPPTVPEHINGYHNSDNWQWLRTPGYVFPGARIVNTTQRKACSVGWIARSGRYSYIVTAGHCGNVGDTFTVTFPDQQSQTVGRLTRGQFINGTQDWALIRLEPDVRVSPRLPLRGPVLHRLAQRGLVDGDSLTPNSTLVCHLGARTGLSCGTYTGTDRDGMIHADGTINHGDSGGPAFAIDATGIYPLGIVSAAPMTGRSEITIQPLAPILDLWSLRFID